MCAGDDGTDFELDLLARKKVNFGPDPICCGLIWVLFGFGWVRLGWAGLVGWVGEVGLGWFGPVGAGWLG